ncbi:MAG: hypothetical protein HC838_17695 [Spirulinaceae cyanobacterium RM2_2_10]|nr:hypothetical protein [Spirulinaceae cyanobacterium SM2_1_0]NJO21503.1 hypothetical protein [Spirulinaceae cyanobacterium RM2_2_10]
MVNFGWNGASIIGAVYCLLVLGYSILGITVAVGQFANNRPEQGLRYLLQVAFFGIIFFVTGGILIFNGWRLDPILQLSHFLLLLVVVYLAAVDLLMGFLNQQR